MSVFQVGIGFPVYWSVFFQVCSVFVVGFSKYRDISSLFSVFHLASKRHVRILKFCFRVNPRILTEDQCPHSRRWQKTAILTSSGLPVAEGGSELSSLDASNPEELTP